jgi:mono/diheme cytochrome c family protein
VHFDISERQPVFQKKPLRDSEDSSTRKSMKIKRALVFLIMANLFSNSGSQALAADADVGKAIFEKNCAGCHGADGKGNAALAKTLGEKGLNIVSKETTQKSDDALLKIIVEGSGKMPASKKLNKDEHKQVLQYSRALGK